jgi:hypothetical protein
MPKAYISIEGKEVISGKVQITADILLTDNSGFVVQHGKPQSIGGNIPRQNIPFDGVAANLINSLEARAIAIAAGLGITIVVTDCVISGVVQGA